MPVDVCACANWQRCFTKMASHTSSLNLTDLNNLEFFVPLSEDFKCPICEDLLIDEPQVTTCGHHFCRRCVEACRMKEPPETVCPKCNEGSFQGTDSEFERQIKEREVYCVNRKRGCVWSGELLALEDHLQKQCVCAYVGCKFERSGCRAKLLQKDVVTHTLSHVVEQFEIQQRSLERLTQEELKLDQLQRRIDKVKMNLTGELKKKSDIKWSPVSAHVLFSVGAKNPCGVKHCSIPQNLVPVQAKEILLLVACCSGMSAPKDVTHRLTLFVEEKGVHYAKYIHITTCKQPARNDNSENMWFPMPTNRSLHFDVPQTMNGDISCTILLTGYR